MISYLSKKKQFQPPFPKRAPESSLYLFRFIFPAFMGGTVEMKGAVTGPEGMA